MKQKTMMAVASFWRSMNSPLVRQISLVVFLCIIIIEVVTLAFSYFSERERLLTRIDQSLELVLPIFETVDDFSAFDTLLVSQGEQATHPLIGLVVMAKHGKAYYLSGETDDLRSGYLPVSRGERFDRFSGIYETYVVTHDEDGEKTRAWFRVDASKVSADLNAYVWRIVRVVLMISLFVTVGCVLALSPILIQPLIELRLQMLATRKNGLGSFHAPSKTLQRIDEIGDAYREFDRMQSALIDAEKTNKAISARFQDFADLGADCFWEVDRALRFKFVAGDVRALFGYEAEEILGRRLQSLSSQKNFPFPDEKAMVDALEQDSHWEGVLDDPSNPDLEKTVRIVSKNLYRSDGTFLGMRGNVTDTTVASKLARDLNHMANHDVLTGLYNRRQFDDLLQTALDEFEKKSQAFCVCLLDLDRFKLVNDTCGHAAGDGLLKQLSAMISKEVRKHDIVSRYGGDEFTLLLKDCELNDGYRICENIRRSIADFQFHWEGKSFDVGVSIGIAEVSSEFKRVIDVMQAADACCYKAKNNGRNLVQVYNPCDEELQGATVNTKWMSRLTAGLERGSFALFQQPIHQLRHDTDTRRLQMEVLLRLFDEEEGAVYSPDSFFPAAERYGLMVRIDKWMLTQTLEWLAENQPPTEMEFLLHINLSSVAALDDEFQQYLKNAVAQADINPAHLCFEFKEPVVVQNIVTIGKFMAEIQTLGCQIAVVDFGMGLSSFGRIKKLPIDYIKIASSFVREIEHSAVDRLMLECITDMAKVLRMKTVAVSVEREETLRVLAGLGVDRVQGHVFSEPAALQSLDHYLENPEVVSPGSARQRAG